DYEHCEECAEHDRLLCTRDRTTLRIEDVGNPGWDPLCFTSPEGIAYYMPALARLALAKPTHEHGWDGTQLLFHLFSGAEYNTFYLYCGSAQRQAVAVLLADFVNLQTESAYENYACDVDDLLRAHELWSRPSAKT